jgi:lipoprotein-anchoring transpeptidase ErfK/SrfK
MNDNQDNHDNWVDEVAGKELVVKGGSIRIADKPVAEKRKHRLRNRITLFSLVVLALAVCGWLAAGVFLTRVSIGSATIPSRDSDAALAETIDRQADAYKLKIVYPDGKLKSFSLTDIGMGVDMAATIKELRKKEQDFSRRLVWWRPTKAMLVVNSNDFERNNFVAKHATVTIQPATSAKLSIKDGEVVITESTTGKHYGIYDPRTTLYNAVATLRSEPLKLDTLSTRPAVTSRQLAPYSAKLKSILHQSVTFTIEERAFQPSDDDIAKWIEIGAPEGSAKIDITVNSGLVEDYINKISGPYVRQSRDQIEFSRDDGTTAVLVTGLKGVDVVDKKAIATKVAKNLLQNKAVDEILRLDTAGFETVRANAYDKWIEVDLTDKQMYLYEQSAVVKTYPISAGAPATPTVKGKYAIYAKIEQQDMRGLNVDGTSYFQPNVAWVNYFYKDYAIHGNYWRPLSWFGNINSSHGCVSLPNTQAQWVYNWAPKGTPVIVHD